MRKKELLTISLMIFSLFFGAGNLIFPPMIGKEAGTNIFTTMIFFMITAIILPILSIISVSKFGGIRNLTCRVGKKFSLIFTIITSLAIGPLLAIPRTGTVPFSIGIQPYLASNISVGLVLFIFTTLFFSLAFILSLNPNKLPAILGKITSRILIILIFVLFIGSIIKPMGEYSIPVEKYSKFYGIQGLLDGYLTLDVMAGLSYGLVISRVIKSYNIKDSEVNKITLITGTIAGIALFIIYSMLGHIGGSSAVMFPNTKNGAEILALITKYLYGNFSVILITLIFTVSCLGVSIGLITALSQYFNQLVPKISYKKWAIIWTLFSFLLANLGLDTIMSYSVPLLMATYPISIVLTILGLIDEKIDGNKLVYRITIYFVAIASVVETLISLNIKLPFLFLVIEKLPLYNIGLSWISVAIFGFIIGIILSNIKQIKMK